MSNKQEMDPRCPLGLKDHPKSFCPMAVIRLKAIRNAGSTLTEEEEKKLPGCPWFVQNQSACYCFFVYMKNFSDTKPLSDVEIAHMNCVSTAEVRRIEEEGLDKVKDSGVFSADDNE